jgi:SAM-dependent methyltransferase
MAEQDPPPAPVARAHVRRGDLLLANGHLEAAHAAYRQALTCDPEDAGAHLGLGLLETARGRYGEALPLFARALERAPTPLARAAFGQSAARTRFTADDPRLRTLLTSAVTEAWAMPHELGAAALTLVLLDARIEACVRRANELWPTRAPAAVLFGEDGRSALAADRLLQALLVAVPVKSVAFERFLTAARHALLESAAQESAPDDAAALDFYAALTQQCFINENVFDRGEAEQHAADAQRERLEALLEAGRPVPPLLLLAVAAYFPLQALPGAARLLDAGQPAALAPVLRAQLREPLEEQRLRADITRLTPISDRVSTAVQAQYEENPYPRWVALALPVQALAFNAELQRALPLARFEPLPDDTAPSILVAGCGTGSDAIFVARRFSGARVLAVDLSLASLAYARRKTGELGITNIEYAQADILELAQLARTFDVIGAVGVLHHLADPFAGWRSLLACLRPKGFMSLGLYSRIARRAVVEARKLVNARGYRGTPKDMRRFRQDALAADASPEIRSLSRSSAFYAMSDCRDLAFHSHEQQVTLPEIAAFLRETGLRFLGFELDQRLLQQYRARFRGDPGAIELRNWTAFEADNPDTFTGMYRFWVQR